MLHMSLRSRFGNQSEGNIINDRMVDVDISIDQAAEHAKPYPLFLTE